MDPSVPPNHSNNPRPGSELRQVHQSIEQSNQAAGKLAKLNALLVEQQDAVVQRLEDAKERKNQIHDAKQEHKDVIIEERDMITRWSAAQAEMQATYELASDITDLATGGELPTTKLGKLAAIGPLTVMGVANIAIQTTGEVKKGNAEKALELAAADFDEALALADADQNLFQAGEEQRNIDRERQSQVLTMMDNGFVRDQELERMDGLQREMRQVQALRDQNNAELTGRYFADPIHYLRSQNSMIRADFAYRSAQRWVFLALRALEYKYNQPFVYTEPIPGSPRWELSSLFKLRNAEELGDLLNAMDQFNLANLGKLNGRTTVTEKVSLKDDVWGRTLTPPAERLAEFRKRIAASHDPQRGVYEIQLNSLRLTEELENGSLFIGAEYGLDGSLITPGYYLDKIEWIKVKFVDSAAPAPVTKPGDLSYGGTCFVRPECALPAGGGLQEPNELRRFPFRYFSMGTDPTTGVLKANSFSEQRATMNFVFWNEPDKAAQPHDDDASTFLRERSVAITDLNLTIAANKVDLGTLQDVHIYIRHLYALRTKCQP